MKTRHFLTIALAAFAAYVLGAGCTQDFDAFQLCDIGTNFCDGACVPPTDPAYGCGNVACTPCNLANAAATCADAECAIAECVEPFRNCDGAGDNGCEADVTADPTQCGACGNSCVVPHAQAGCQAGECTVAMCDTGWDDCDGLAMNGCEADTLNDPQNCGGCGADCPTFQSCVNGQCVLNCDPGTGDCDNDPSNGCETDLGTIENCGFCGDSCDLANATGTCQGGMCAIESCNGGFEDCNAMAADGCEANLDDSAMTCGDCNTACPNGPNGTTVCNGGQCEINCNAGFGDCDGALATGCETDTDTSNTHCGDCGVPCMPQNGNAACMSGVCQLMGCADPFADCDGNPNNGCETNTDTSAANCGMCGQACSFPNAGATCSGGTCQMGACNGTFEDCNGSAADGCEVDTDTSANHCGNCNNACPSGPNATASCNNGNCSLACDGGFGDCDGNAANGCEIATGANVDHCGGCNRPCSAQNVASKSCAAGVCNSTCDLGFGNCSQPMAPNNDNGCETNVLANDDNCGGCGNSCTNQGGSNDLECDGGNGMQQTCGCANANPMTAIAECANAGVNLATVSCSNNMGQGLCVCSGTTCAPGESCVAAGGGMSACSCETAPNGAACGANQVCCFSPAGCRDLQTDPQSCGACGHACAAGFVCNAGSCRCNEAADCNAGTMGTFTCDMPSGLCVCNGNQCNAGERCLPNGQCG